MTTTPKVDTASLDRLAWQANELGAPQDVLDAIHEAADQVDAWLGNAHLAGPEAVAEEIVRALGIGGTGRRAKVQAVRAIVGRFVPEEPTPLESAGMVLLAETIIRNLGLPVSSARLEAVLRGLQQFR
jgi:hypothetical protein